MPETPDKDARQLNRQAWEPAGVVSVADATNTPAESRTPADKGGALKLEVENAFHDDGLIQGKKQG